MPPRFVVLIPVLDDWESLGLLIAGIDRRVGRARAALEIIAIDDGSVSEPSARALTPRVHPDSCVERISVLRLALNLGHQRAIAVGLASVARRTDLRGAIVMDGDGEDRPEDLPRLIAEAAAHDDRVIFARRAQRSEGIVFRTGYFLYKFIFRALTGKEISFGNFSLIPMAAVRRLAHMPELWNNLPAAIVRSRLRYRAIDTTRGVRYAGVSRMNLPSLIVHGLSAMSVYADIVFVRVVIAACAVSAVAVTTMAAVAAIRIATDLAVPGWATTVFGDLCIVLVLALVIVIATTFMVLAARTARPFVPIADTGIFVAEWLPIAERNLEARIKPASVPEWREMPVSPAPAAAAHASAPVAAAAVPMANSDV